MPITGLTRIVAVIGDPIDGARAPEALGAVIAGLDLDGILVTMPHKAAMRDLVDHVSAQAKLTGAVNLVRRAEDGELWGDQIDGEGFTSSLTGRGFEPGGMDVVMLGAGGVARSIAF